jgi:hypothetical protein
VGITRDRLYSILCVVLVVASVLATVPILEMGTNDDWSYNWVARELANTGHFVFNGWIGAMIGVQAVWAALLIRAFGFSFTLVRLSTLPFAAGCAFLLYRLGRSAGLNPSFALFGTLSVTLSPVFIPVAASFMTDVPGFFFWLASVYYAVRVVQSSSTGRACGWMAAMAVAGAAGGTIRQVVWFVPLVALPIVAWIRRRQRPAVICALLLWCASMLALVLSLRWFNAQINTASTLQQYEPETWLDILQETMESALQIIVGTLLLSLPVLGLFLISWKKWLRAPIPLVLGLAGAGALLGGLLWFGDDLLLGNMITPTGILGTLDLPGNKPEILTTPVRFLLGAGLVVSTGVTVAMVFDGWRSWRVTASSDLRRFLTLYGPPCLVYTAAILYRSVTEWLLFDRYFILLMPLLTIPLLWYFQERIRGTPPSWGWVLMGLFALFGIAMTHDYLAAGRARLLAATTATSAGIPRTHISAGLEYDGWTQLEQTGRIPPPAEQASGHSSNGAHRYPISPPYWFWPKTPAVDPKYVVTHSRLPGLVDSQFPPIPYTAWLPPFRREVFTQKAPE